MKVSTQTITLFSDEKPLILESGKRIGPVTVAYQTYGTLNAEGTNAILICHALTGNAHAAGVTVSNDISYAPNRLSGNNHPPVPREGWWSGVIGDGKAIDTSKYFVICSNFLGSCYGTTGPASTNPATGEPYRMDFPRITVRDMVRVQCELLKHLGVNELVTVTGGSLGGMQVLEWTLMYPDMVHSIVPIAVGAYHSAWAIGLNEIARNAIRMDPDWNEGRYTAQPRMGLALARMVAMMSYRSQISFEEKFGREIVTNDTKGVEILFGKNDPLYQVESYLRYQGIKLVERFDANTYIHITYAMDSHDVSRDRGSISDVLGSVEIPVLCIGINSDVLYPVCEQHELVKYLPYARYAEIDSIHGHDAFLIEFDQLNKVILSFLEEVKVR